MRQRFRSLLLGFGLMLSASPATAELRLSVSGQGDHRLVLENAPSEVQSEVVALVDGVYPMEDVIDCATVEARLLPEARSTQLTMDAMLARYNLTNVWLGNVCPHLQLVQVSDGEARGWLIELAGLRDSSDGSPFLRARDMLVESYLFGAGGFAPDFAAARAALADVPEQRRRLYAAYMAEHGLGEAGDLVRSTALLDEAANAGHPTAGALLAQRLELGLGVPQDEAAALARYRTLAEGISPPVWYRLGVMLLDGRGAPADACEARAWLRRAASHGWSPVTAATPALARIENQGLCVRP